jgi:hypothetical protein
MRYSLRTFLMFMAIGPQKLALSYWRAVELQELWREQKLEAVGSGGAGDPGRSEILTRPPGTPAAAGITYLESAAIEQPIFPRHTRHPISEIVIPVLN